MIETKSYIARKLPVAKEERGVEILLNSINEPSVYLYIQVENEVFFLGRGFSRLQFPVNNRGSITQRRIVVVPTYDGQQLKCAEEGLKGDLGESYTIREFDGEVFFLGGEEVTEAVEGSLHNHGYRQVSKGKKI